MARNKALLSAQRAYRRGQKARQIQANRVQKAQKKKKRVKEETQISKPKGNTKKASTAKPKTPSTDVSSQYKSYQNSSFAPKTYKAPKKSSTTSSFKPSSSKVTVGKSIVSRSPEKKKYDYKKDLQQAYKKYTTSTYLGTQQKATTTTLKSKRKQKQEYKATKKSYYKSQDWTNTKNELKTKNREGWRRALSAQGWSRAEIDKWMNSDEGKKYRRETYMEAKNATKKSINKSIAKDIKETSKLKSVNALTKGEFNKMVTGSSLGKDLGNKYLKSVGGDKLLEKIGSKTVEAGLRSKGAYGVIQGMSKGDIWSGSVGKYNKSAKEGIKQVKSSGAYNVGYGVGMALDMGMGSVATRGASLAELAGKGASKLIGKGVAKEVPKKALKEATEEIAKVSAKDGAKRFAKNRVGELVAESPTNVMDAVKMSLDENGNLDKGEFKKWLIVNNALTVGVGGAIEGIGAGATKKLASKTEELIAKREAGTITADELTQLNKNIKKLTQKAKGDIQSMSSDIADARMKGFNAKDAQRKAEKYGELVKDSANKGRKQGVKKGKFTYEASQSRYNYAKKLNENEQRLLNRRIAHEQPKLNEKGVAMRRAENFATAQKQAKALANEAKKYPDRATIRKQIDEATELLNNLKSKAENPNVPKKDRMEQIKKLEDRVAELRRQEGVVWRAEKAVEKAKVSAPKARVAKAQKAVKTAKEAFEKNPTPETRARMEVAEEAVNKVKAEAKAQNAETKQTVEELNANAKKELSPKERTRKKIDSKTEEIKKIDEQIANIERQLKDVDARGRKLGGQRKTATDPNWRADLDTGLKSIDSLRNDLNAEIYKLRREKTALERERTELEDQFEKLGGYAKLPESELKGTGLEGTPSAKAVMEEASADLDNIPKTSRISETGVVNATTKEGEFKSKHPLINIYRNVVRRAIFDNLDPLEYIARHLPEAQSQKMMAQINELRRAVKTGRAMVAEKGRNIYRKYDLTKPKNKQKLLDYDRYCLLKHDLARIKEGSGVTGLDEKGILKEIKEYEGKYIKAVRNKDGSLALDSNGYATLLGKDGKPNGYRVDVKNGTIIDKDGVVVEKELLDVAESEVKDFQKDIVQYFRDLMEMEVEAGITSRRVADSYMKRFPDYIPTYRESKFEDILKNRTFEEIDVGRGMKMAKGGGEDPIVPLYNQMQTKTNTVMKRVQLNKTLELLCTASGTTEKELDALVPFFKDMRPEEKAEALADAQIFPHEMKGGKYKAVMYRQGSKIEMDIDKDVYNAIRSWSGDDRKLMVLSHILNNRALGTVASQFKKWITDYNLIFGVKNLKRDMATALFYTNDVKGFVKNMPKGFAVCLLPDKFLTKEMKLYKEAYQVYKENGGVISQFIARDSASDKLFDSASKLNILKQVENFNSAMETIPRMTEFISALDSKASVMAKEGKNGVKDYEDAFRWLLGNRDEVAKAMYRAKDVTLNFDRSGWLGSMLNRGAVPFFNPASQGLDKLGRKLIADNIKYGKNGINPTETMASFMKMGVYFTGMAIMPTMAWNHMVGDYINGEVEGYEKQSDYNRYANYLVPIGDGKFIKIPKARELASLQAMCDYAYDNMKYGSGTKWERLFGEEKFRDLKSMFKISWEQTGTINPFTDSLFAPIWRVKNNQTWYGGKIESGRDLDLREAGEYSKIWDENTSAIAKWIGKKYNVSPKKVDNVMDSYLGIIYDYFPAQTSAKNDFRQVWKEEGALKGVAKLTRTPWGNAFIIDSVFSNANKTDYYDSVEKRNEKLKGMKEGSDEYLELKSELTKDKTAYSYTSSQYDELQAQIWLDDKLTMKQKQKYARMLKQGDNALWGDRKDGRTAPKKDPMAVIWNMKTDDGKQVLSTDRIIDACSYTFKNGGNTIKDAWTAYKKNKGYSATKFMNVTLKARDIQRSAGDSLTTPRWEVVAYSTQLNHLKGSDKVLASYIENDKKRNHLMANARIYEQFGGNLKTYKTERKTITQGVFDLGYEYVGSKDIPDGVITMILANARTKKGGKYRDLAYQANDFYIMNRMNSARCLDHKRNGNHTAKEVDDLCKKYKLKPNDDYTWDTDKVVRAINKDYPNATNEVKASLFQVITGLTKSNPFGAIGDYSLANDTGVYCEGGYGGWGRRRGRRWHRWGHGGGGGRGKAFKPEELKLSGGTTTASGKSSGSRRSSSSIKTTKAKSSDVTFNSNLNDAYRKKVKKLREETRHNK